MTMVSRHRRPPSAISLVIRGRGTAQSGTPGTVILAARMGIPAETAGRLAGAATCPATLATIGIFLLRRRPDDRSPWETTRRDTAARPPSGRLALIHQQTQASQARHHAIGIKNPIGMNFRTLGCSDSCDPGNSVPASRPRGRPSRHTTTPAPHTGSPSSLPAGETGLTVQEPEFPGSGDHLVAGGDTQLPVDRHRLRFDGVRRHEPLARDLRE